MPVQDDIGKAYTDYYTHSEPAVTGNSFSRKIFRAAKQGYLANKYGYYERVLPWWARLLGQAVYLYPGRPAELDFSVMWLPASKRGQLLDVGCGSGWLISQMQGLGWHVEGVDFDPVSVQSANNRGLAVHLGSLEAQKFASCHFDVVTMSHAIEHVHDPLGLLKECRRILKPGGRLVVVTPNTESLGHRIYKDKWLALDPPRHLHLFNLTTLNHLARLAGFGNFSSFTSIRDANGTFIASRSILRTGRHSMGNPQSKVWRTWGRMMQALEAVLRQLNPRFGEDIVLFAET
jgi:2-polyprenyl-3-methyl-5-hydroxy-6-metoxy-1,4-benzoquinol methylase